MPARSTTLRSCASPQRPRTFGERSAFASEPVRSLSNGDLLAERAVRLLACAVEILDGRADPAQRFLQRRDRRLELGARRVEEPGARLLERLVRRGAHGVGEPLVEARIRQTSTRAGHPGELPLELDHPPRGVCCGPPAIEQRRAQQQQGAEGAGGETDEQRGDRHEGKER